MEAGQAKLKTVKPINYFIGYVLSLGLTLIAFYFVYRHTHGSHIVFRHSFLRMITAALAILQLFVQLMFFLHLGQETRPRWRLLTFGFMLVVVIVIVFGSIWIMDNLNYRMTPQQINQYLKDQDGGI